MELKERNEEHWEPLAAIAREELGVPSLVQSGKITNDVHLVRIASLAQALERAYDLGLLMGHRVSRMEQGQALPSKLVCRDGLDGVRAAATEWLRTCASKEPQGGEHECDLPE
ncbi:hypothetical protein VSR82_31705 [Burkholderia sp. JPY481]|uniref:DUF6900 domain-containing protein n=1 Tax=Paraburkholderia sp. JPY465 TaxID=3042285 RepID=UPI00316DA6AB